MFFWTGGVTSVEPCHSAAGRSVGSTKDGWAGASSTESSRGGGAWAGVIQPTSWNTFDNGRQRGRGGVGSFIASSAPEAKRLASRANLGDWEGLGGFGGGVPSNKASSKGSSNADEGSAAAAAVTPSAQAATAAARTGQ